MLRRDAKVLVKRRVGRAGAEAVHADEAAALAEEAVPALADAGFDDDAGRDFARQDARAIRLILLVKPFDAGHTDEPNLYAVGGQLLPRLDGNIELTARGDEDCRRLSTGSFMQDVSAA